jgi:hypothetical protein
MSSNPTDPKRLASQSMPVALDLAGVLNHASYHEGLNTGLAIVSDKRCEIDELQLVIEPVASGCRPSAAYRIQIDDGMGNAKLLQGRANANSHRRFADSDRSVQEDASLETVHPCILR